MAIATIEEAIEDLRKGRMIVLMDDKNRENEGDLCMAAEKVTPDAINFMAKYGRGLICLPLTEDRVEQLGLTMMVSDNTSPFGTAFTVSIDGVENVTTGISASDRAITILKAIADDAKPQDLVTPGHIFPLAAKNGGVLVRAGQTEGSVDLSRLAGLKPAGVICEVMKDDGTMARLPDLEKFSAKHKLKLVTVPDLIQYRLKYDSLVFRAASAHLPTRNGGEFEAIVYNTHIDQSEHLALVKGNIGPKDNVLVRVHSKYVPGDVFAVDFQKPETRIMLQRSMELIAEEGKGIILYLQIEGKGMGPIQRRTTRDRDFKDFGIGAQILRDLGVQKMRLLTNNPKNLVGLSGYGLEVTGSVPFDVKQQGEPKEKKATRGKRSARM
ncbi:MAG: 3,4-dihydroxy-2-butanone-4-phosphate synthase [Deltaproteobacteria bacterium]|nr:3,4-dihydroxy-2-butanone-4-phosphate synthase [Deltaproteobacteria bacterium]